MNIEVDRERFSQTIMLNSLMADLSLNEMVTVYLSDRDGPHSHGIYCALTPSDQIGKALASPSWDLHNSEGLPGAVEYYEDDERHVEYLRYGDRSGIEPLVIDREFYGMRDDYCEISEEFRLFHRLYHDRKTNHYIKIDDDGNDHPVAIVEPNQIKIRLKELRQFLAVKEMHLSVQFDCRERSDLSLEEMGLKEGTDNHCTDRACWFLHHGGAMGVGSHLSFSRLLGKRLIEPLPKEKSGFWGFSPEPTKQYIDYIIGSDGNGDEVTAESNPKRNAG